MTKNIDVHDLPDEEIKLLQEFVEFLRKRLKTKHLLKEEEEKDKDKEWSKLAITSFTKDWENEKDAIYDAWREHYHVSEG